MKLDVTVRPPRRLRLWLGELPSAHSAAIETIVESAPCDDVTTAGDARRRTAAVEVFTLSGPKVDFALIGGAFTPGQATLTVRLAISSEKGPLLAETINMYQGTTHIGLPREYAGAVIDAAFSSGLAGHMELDHAAHCEVGSCNVMFRLATRLLCQCFARDRFEDEDEFLTAMSDTIEARHRLAWLGVRR